ncbi:hypothetical protein Tco_1348922, partial [Tanacetum coccineum]
NVGNGGRYARRSFGNQGESADNGNVQKETRNGNVRRILQTSATSKIASNVQKMLLAKKDEVGIILTNEQNDFLLADASKIEELKYLSANICMMARIQQADSDSKNGPSYDSAFISKRLMMEKLITNAHDQQDNAMELLARNAYKEAGKQRIIAKKVNQQNVKLTKELEKYNKKVRDFENKNGNKTHFQNKYIEADKRAIKLKIQFQA